MEFQIPGKIVVQIQKIRNVSAPKANEESRAAPRMLKLTLTDGHNCCQAVELESIPALRYRRPLIPIWCSGEPWGLLINCYAGRLQYELKCNSFLIIIANMKTHIVPRQNFRTEFLFKCLLSKNFSNLLLCNCFKQTKAVSC